MASLSKKAGEVERMMSRRHPLQRFDSPSKGFSGALHVSDREKHMSRGLDKARY
jgi:hypothetical protein